FDDTIRCPKLAFATSGHDGDPLDVDLRADSVFREDGLRADGTKIGGPQGSGHPLGGGAVAVFCCFVDEYTTCGPYQQPIRHQASHPLGKCLFRFLVKARTQMLAPENVAAHIIEHAQSLDSLQSIHKYTRILFIYSISVHMMNGHLPVRRDVLRLHELEDAVMRAFASKPALLDAAKWRGRVR